MKATIIISILISVMILGCKPKSETQPVLKDSTRVESESWFMAGKVEAKEKADIISTFTARIIKVNKEIGEHVNKGEAVVTLDRKEVTAQLDALQKNYDTAYLNLTRAQSLFESRVISQQQKEQAEMQCKQAKAALEQGKIQLENGTLLSPIDGIVTAVNVKDGEISSSSLVLLTIINTKGIYVNAYIPESLMNEVKPGMSVLLRFSEIKDKIYHGKISLIDSMVDSKSKTALVKILPSDFDADVKPGMTVMVGKEINIEGR